MTQQMDLSGKRVKFAEYDLTYLPKVNRQKINRGEKQDKGGNINAIARKNTEYGHN